MAKLSCLKLVERPFYIALPAGDPLAAQRELRLENMQNRNWVLFSRHVGAYLYDMIQQEHRPRESVQPICNTFAVPKKRFL